MSADIVAARERLRALVRPLHHDVSSYSLKEKVGAGIMEHIDDRLQVEVSCTVFATALYPRQQYDDSMGRVNEGAEGLVSSEVRAEAIEKAYQVVLSRVPRWQHDIAIDAGFRERVGAPVTFRITESRGGIMIPAGMKGVIEKHGPAWVTIRVGSALVEIGTWRFMNYAYRTVGLDGHPLPDGVRKTAENAKELEIPDPAVTFDDGWAPRRFDSKEEESVSWLSECERQKRRQVP